MMRWFKIFIIGVALITFFNIKVIASPEIGVSPYVYINDTTIEQGNNQYVSLYIQNAYLIGSLDVSIYYDTKLTVSNAYQSYILNNAIADINYSTPGVIHFSFVSLSGISTSNESLFSFMISTTNTPSDLYELDILVGEAYDINLNLLTVNADNAKINIIPKVQPKYYGSIYADISHTTLEIGDTFTYSLNSFALNNITSGNVVVSYDNTKIKVNKININSHFKNQSTVYSLNNDIPGTIQFSFASLLAVYNLTGIIDVVFESIINDNTTSHIQSNITNAYNADLDPIEFSTISNQLQFTSITEDTVYPKIKLSSYVGFSNEPFTIEVMIDQNSGLAAGSFEINYDMFYFSIVEINIHNDVLNSNAILMTNPNVDYGSVKFSYINEQGLYEAQTLLSITFQPNYDNFIFTSTMTIQSIGDLVNESYEPVTLEYINSNLSLTDALIYNYIDFDGSSLGSFKVLPTETPTPPTVDLRPNTLFKSWNLVSTTKDSMTYQASYTLDENAYSLLHTEKIYDQLPLNIQIESITEGTHFELSYSNNHNVGTYDITIRAYLDGVYQYTVIEEGKILPKPISILIDSLTIAYNTVPNFNYVIEGLYPGDDLELNYDQTTRNLGINSIIPAIDNPNYLISYNAATLTIEKAYFTLETLPSQSLTVEYNGTSQRPVFDGVLPEGFTYEIVGDAQRNAGEYNYTLQITHNNPNYYPVDPLSIEFTIKPKTIEIIADDKESYYQDDFVPLTYQVVGTIYDEIVVSLIKSSGTTVGFYDISVVVTEQTNYTFIITNGTYHIMGKEVNLDLMNLPIMNVTYDGKTHAYNPEFTLPTGIQSITYDSTLYTLPGEYRIDTIVSIQDGFEAKGTLKGTLIIEKAVINSVSFTDTTVSYDGLPKSPKISGLVTEYGDLLTVNYPNGNEFINAGTYQITANISHPNYKAISIEVTFIIEKASRNLSDLTYTITHNTITFNTTHQTDLFVSVNLDPYTKTNLINDLNPDTTYSISLYLNETNNYLMSEIMDIEIRTYQSLDVLMMLLDSASPIKIESKTILQEIMIQKEKLSLEDQSVVNEELLTLITAYNDYIKTIQDEYSGAIKLKQNLSIYAFTALIPTAFAVVYWRKRL